MRFDLDKATETLQFELQKRDIGTITPCQVTVTMDVSGSFEDEHRDGYTQELLNRLVPFAMVFDKDKSIDMFAFSSDAEHLKTLNVNNYTDYIRKYVMTSSVFGYMTYYGKAFKMLADASAESSVKKAGFIGKLFGKKDEVSEPEKFLHFFVTDGSPSDGGSKAVLDRLMATTPNAFFVFISIGRYEIDELKQYQNTTYSNYFNLTVAEFQNLHNASDADLYSLVINNALTNWMK